MSSLVLNLEKTEKIREEIKAAVFTNIISLSFCCLKAFPSHILGNESILKLKRLDLSHNHISDIPSEISTLVNLKEIWLQHNPIVNFPAGLQLMPKLEVIDISNTLIQELPSELANLTKLYELDWRSTPLVTTLNSAGVEVNDILKLKKYLKSVDTRKHLEMQLHEYLEGEHYIQDADKKGITGMIRALVQVRYTFYYSYLNVCMNILLISYFYCTDTILLII